MKITIAKTAGFCMGVRRAVEMVLDASNNTDEPICTYGPLIHNPQVLSLLEEKGVPAINEIPAKGVGTVLIRAHGVPPQAKKKLEDAGFTVKDATCPRVIKVQTIIRKHAEKGYHSIIIGDHDHPEVIGLLGYADGKGCAVGNFDDLSALPDFEKAIIVAQTTQNTQFYEDIIKWAEKNHPHYKVFNTICDSTEKRQTEIKQIAENVAAVIVVGGKNSGNTQRLAEVAAEAGKPSFHIESEDELDFNKLKDAGSIGITAGASTPNWIIKKVWKTLESELSKKKKGWRRFLFYATQYLLRSNIYLSAGAGCLCFASTLLQGGSYLFRYSLTAMLYILSMQIFNNLTAIKADRYNDPDKASFYHKNRYPFAALAFISGILVLGIAFTLGTVPFIILTIMSLLGLCYNLNIIPRSCFNGKYRSIRDLPGSKSILIAVAWGIVTSLVPSLFNTGDIHAQTVIALIWTTGLAFSRTAFFDILDMQGDRIVGRETIPIILGEEKTAGFLTWLLAALVLFLPLTTLSGLTTKAGLLLWLCPLTLLALVTCHKKGLINPGLKLELLVESNFILAGLLTLAFAIL